MRAACANPPSADACPAPSSLASLRASIRGYIYTPEEERYTVERRIWNADIDRKPALIGVNDVRLAVAYARANKLRITIRGGGHNFCGYSIADNALLLDLSLMRSVRMNVKRQTVRAEGGCLLRDIDRETALHQLCVPLGAVSLTGAAGLTLGGGVGWLAPLYGLACHNLIGVDLVLADGTFLQLSEETDREIMWGLRGGGNGNFGVVTSLKYRLHPLPSPAHTMFFEFPFAKCIEVAGLMMKLIGEDRIPPHVSPYVFIGEEPPRLVVIGAALGPTEEVRQVLAPLLALEPIMTQIIPTTWPRVQSMTDAHEYPGQIVYCKSAFIKNEVLKDPTAFLIALLAHWSRVPGNEGLMIGIELFWRGNFEKIAKTANAAFPHCGSRTSVLFNAHIPRPSDRNEYIAWCREGVQALREFLVQDAVYCNYAPPEEAKESTFTSNLARLQALKKKLDPEGLFIGYLDKVTNPLYPK